MTREKILELGVTYSVRKLKEIPNEDPVIEMCTLTFLHKLFFMDVEWGGA